MSVEDNYMDECFRKLRDDFTVNYHSDFWNDALAQLENDALDQAFRDAAQQSTFSSAFVLNQEELGDAFMDDAFREASNEVKADYNPAFFTEMEAASADLNMDLAFSEAADEIVVNYSPLYWGDANSALESEGLHYEYQHAFWDEARDLLDKEDRKMFFAKWAGAAMILLLVSFFGIQSNFDFNLAKVDRIELKSSQEKLTIKTLHERINSYSAESDQGTVHVDQHKLNEISELVSVPRNLESTSPAETLQENTQLNNGLENNLVQNERITELNETINGEESSSRGDQIVVSSFEIETFETNTGENQIGLENHLNHNQFIAHFTRPISLIPVQKEQGDLAANERIEIEKIELKPMHQISIVGLAGLGKNYGANTYLLTKRYGARLEYVNTASKGFRNANSNHFEWGTQFGFNYVECDGLGIENQVTLFKKNGGTEKYWRNLQLFDLFYLNVGVFTNYVINQNHKLRAGISCDRLFAVQSNMAYRMDDDKGIQTVNNNWGVQDGISSLDLNLSLGYEYRINYNWALQLNLTSGILNRTDNDFFNATDGRDIERSLTLGIRRTLFTKL